MTTREQHADIGPNTGASMKERVYLALNPLGTTYKPGLTLARVFALIIMVNVLAAVLETDSVYYAAYGTIFDIIAYFSMVIFSVEYALRLWTCTCNPAYRHPVRGRLRYAATPLALIDLVTIAPLYVSIFIPDPSLSMLFRFSRIFWILKLGHYLESMQTFGAVVRAKKNDLFVSFFLIILLIIISSSLLFWVEHDAQPEKFSSVIASLWWGVETMATVGYGDIYPVTFTGKLIGSFVMLMGIGLFAVPAGIFASGFVEVRHKRDEKTRGVQRCPHCGAIITNGKEEGDGEKDQPTGSQES